MPTFKMLKCRMVGRWWAIRRMLGVPVLQVPTRWDNVILHTANGRIAAVRDNFNGTLVPRFNIDEYLKSLDREHFLAKRELRLMNGRERRRMFGIVHQAVVSISRRKSVMPCAGAANDTRR